MVGEFELSGLVLDRGRWGPRMESEQLGVEQLGRQSPAQFTFTNGLSRRSDAAHSARATEFLAGAATRRGSAP